MERLFIETSLFSATVDSAGGKEFLESIQQEVLEDLKLSLTQRSIIPGSGGFIKLRVADPDSGKGKSGGWRIIYFDLPILEITFLILLYPKSVKENLSQKQTMALKALSQELKKWRPENLRKK